MATELPAPDLAHRFENVLQRLLSRELLDLYEEDVSFMFEVIATNLLGAIPERKSMYFDGVIDLKSTLRKAQQVEFTGEMWVGENQSQWRKDFRALVTDKRVTKQGITITLWIGSDKVESELSKAFGLPDYTISP